MMMESARIRYWRINKRGVRSRGLIVKWSYASWQCAHEVGMCPV